MSAPHYAIVYNKPRAQVTDGLQQLDRFDVFNYKHTIAAFGGFDSASFDLAINPRTADGIFEAFLGNEVRVYVDNPRDAIFEGYINRITVDTGIIAASISLDAVYNRVAVSYSDDTGTERAKLTTEAMDTNSALIYGVKMGVFEIGEQYSDGASFAATLRDRKLAQHAWPQATYAQSSGTPAVKIELKGFYHTWEWDAFEIVTTITSFRSTVLPVVTLTDDPGYVIGVTPARFSGYNSSRDPLGLGNGTGVFYRSAYNAGGGQDALGLFPLNVPGGPTSDYNRSLGTTMLSRLREVADIGDFSDGGRIVIGLTDSSSYGERYPYYRRANTNIEYRVDAYGDGRIYTVNGSYVYPWEVRPDRFIRIDNLLTGSSSTELSQVYVDSITYNADQQSVKWQSDDDTTLQGVMQLQRQSRPTSGLVFGSTPRLTKG